MARIDSDFEQIEGIEGAVSGRYAHFSVLNEDRSKSFYAFSDYEALLVHKNDNSLWIAFVLPREGLFEAPSKLMDDVKKIEVYSGRWSSAVYILDKDDDLYYVGAINTTLEDIKSPLTPELLLTDVLDATMTDDAIRIIRKDGSVWVVGRNDGGMLSGNPGDGYLLYDESYPIRDIPELIKLGEPWSNVVWIERQGAADFAFAMDSKALWYVNTRDHRDGPRGLLAENTRIITPYHIMNNFMIPRGGGTQAPPPTSPSPSPSIEPPPPPDEPPQPPPPPPPSSQTHTVTFDLAGGQHMGGGALEQEVEHGKAATAPETSRMDWEQDGWDKQFDNVTEDITVTAVWKPSEIKTTQPSAVISGNVVAVGDNYDGQCNVTGWRDIVAISAAGARTIGLKSDGTVVAVGDNTYGENDIGGWRDITAIAAGYGHTVGLKSDGTVVAVGWNDDGQCNVSGWSDIVAISAGFWHTVGLKSDGTVVATGNNEHGKLNVSGWQNIIQIYAGELSTIGLKSDGTVVILGDNFYGQNDVSGWSDIIAISAGHGHTVGLKSDGTVVAVGYNYEQQCNVSGWSDIVSVRAGGMFTLGLKSDGTVIAVGDNASGQLNVSEWRNVVALAADWNHSVGIITG